MKIITNTAVSLDGKISVFADKVVYLGSDEDRKQMSVVRAQADAILVGGNSFRNVPVPMLPRPEHRTKNYDVAPIWNVVMTRSFDVPVTERFLAEKQVRPLFISPAATPEGFPCETVTMDPVTPSGVVLELKRRGVETLLIEAGGDVIAQFLAEGLVDEMYITLCPKLIGGTAAPSLIGGRGFSSDDIKTLKLVEHRVCGDEVFLRYAVVKP